ncbi:hypothetical protein CsSME_00011546 [Camellia sinensis var. sinensis]
MKHLRLCKKQMKRILFHNVWGRIVLMCDCMSWGPGWFPQDELMLLYYQLTLKKYTGGVHRPLDVMMDGVRGLHSIFSGNRENESNCSVFSTIKNLRISYH